ncbi:MAG: hypothetical protein ACRDUY_02270 [Nitriliruptorales bacterium]
MGDWREDPEFVEVARELREWAGAELREEAEEGERLAALAAARGRTLSDVAAELRSRGDRVAVRTGGRTIAGVVTHAGGDFFTLETAATTVEVNLRRPVVLTVVERAPSGGREPAGGAATFRGRLLELEMDDAEIDVVVEGGDVLSGRLGAVGRDHLVLRGAVGEETFVATAAIDHVARLR